MKKQWIVGLGLVLLSIVSVSHSPVAQAATKRGFSWDGLQSLVLKRCHRSVNSTVKLSDNLCLKIGRIAVLKK